jgi:hypothetical protein
VGTVVIVGMFAATVIAIFIIPVTSIPLRGFQERQKRRAIGTTQAGTPSPATGD